KGVPELVRLCLGLGAHLAAPTLVGRRLFALLGLGLPLGSLLASGGRDIRSLGRRGRFGGGTGVGRRFLGLALAAHEGERGQGSDEGETGRKAHGLPPVG